jgi:hypothetical protein
MLKAKKLLGSILLGIVVIAALGVFLWWRHEVDDRLGYCQTPTQTCINREGMPVGEPCECHGMGGGVFGLDSTGKVIPR